ncbi:MAG: BlaI/MecI/CopY family transcriptional regulator [Gemmatimonadaceae bacterium]|nr:BlaI/MecI/CopY family transcriptional regulator [Gemmatimonadaceae bacterium]
MSQPQALPTDAELQLLRHLWSHGPSTVRTLHEAVYGAATSYTTTLRLVQNLHAKRLVLRDADERQHVYAAAVNENVTMAAITRRVMDRAFGGSAAELAMRALDARPASREELRELKKLIARMEKAERSDEGSL